MKLLSVYDDVADIKVPNGNLKENPAIHLLDADTDKAVREIAKKYFDSKNVRLKRMESENAYMIFTNTDINYGGNLQAQGIYVQYDMLAGEMCSLLFFSAPADKMQEIKSIRNFKYGVTLYNDENVAALEAESLLYDKQVLKMFREVGKENHIDEKDNSVVWKNLYLILSRAKMTDASILFDIYSGIKDIPGVTDCRYSKPDKCVSFNLNSHPQRINIVGGDIPEMNGCYFTRENIVEVVKRYANNEFISELQAADGKIPIGQYSKSRLFVDIIDARFQEKYMAQSEERDFFSDNPERE